jgi:uncharacterized membrane protein YozB (DUF420 family)
MEGFLGTSASFFSDAVVVVELLIATLLIVGMLIVRRGHVRAHMYLQSSMVLVNIPIVLSWMVPQYLALVAPDTSEILEPTYLVPTLMLAAGIVAELLGIYIILVAGTNLVPERFRFRRYKLVMRTELALWWTVVLAGLTTYYLWYAAAAGPS